MAPSVERVQQALAREQQRLLTRSQHKDSELLRTLCRNPDVCAHLESFMAKYQAAVPHTQLPLLPAGPQARPTVFSRAPSPSRLGRKEPSKARQSMHKRHPRKNKTQQYAHFGVGPRASNAARGPSSRRQHVRAEPAQNSLRQQSPLRARPRSCSLQMRVHSTPRSVSVVG